MQTKAALVICCLIICGLGCSRSLKEGEAVNTKVNIVEANRRSEPLRNGTTENNKEPLYFKKMQSVQVTLGHALRCSFTVFRQNLTDFNLFKFFAVAILLTVSTTTLLYNCLQILEAIL